MPIKNKKAAIACGVATVSGVGFLIWAFSGDDEAPATTAQPVTYVSKVVKSMDFSAEPCDDFYQYACGEWVKQNPLSKTESSKISSFSKVQALLDDALKTILSQDPSKVDDAWLKQALYAHEACLDEKEIDAEASKFLESLFALDGVKELVGSGKVTEEGVAALHKSGVPFLFALQSLASFDDPKTFRPWIMNAGFGLGSVEQYDSDEVVKVYQKYAQSLFAVNEKGSDAAKLAEAVVAFEKGWAKTQPTSTEARDPKSQWNPTSFDKLADWQIATESFNFEKYADEAGSKLLADDKFVNVAALDWQATKASAFLKAADAQTIAAYARFAAYRVFAPFLNKGSRAAAALFAQESQGATAPTPRAEFCKQNTVTALGWVLGKEYVEKHFDKSRKQLASDIIDKILAQFEANLKEGGEPWMDKTTQGKAIEKKNAIRKWVAYPSWLEDDAKLTERYELLYGKDFVKAAADDESLEIVDGFMPKATTKRPIATTMLMLQQASFAQQITLANAAQPDEFWGMTPITVNAYYDPSGNLITFPAAILNEPFLIGTQTVTDEALLLTLNTGAYGVVSGHELTHGFDDQGAQYDKDGKFSNWWKKDTYDAFKNRTTCMVEEYSKFTVPTGDHVNGQNCLGENIADNGGFKLSARVLETSLSKAQLEAKVSDASIPDGHELNVRQMHYVAFAQLWCAVQTDEFQKQQVETNVHSPPQFRVLGSVLNSKYFDAAFECKKGSKMNPTGDDKCEVW